MSLIMVIKEKQVLTIINTLKKYLLKYINHYGLFKNYTLYTFWPKFWPFLRPVRVEFGWESVFSTFFIVTQKDNKET